MKTASLKQKICKKGFDEEIGVEFHRETTIMLDVACAGVIFVINLNKVCDANLNITKHAILAQIRMGHSLNGVIMRVVAIHVGQHK